VTEPILTIKCAISVIFQPRVIDMQQELSPDHDMIVVVYCNLRFPTRELFFFFIHQVENQART